MKGQRNFDMSGTSRLSLADAGLGAAAGFLVPVITEKLISEYATTTEFFTNAESGATNTRLVAAAAGLVVAIPLYYWRGFAPALVAAALALVYGAGSYVATWVNQLGTDAAPQQMGRLGAGRSVGLLQQAARQRQLGALQQARMPQAGGRRRRSMEFAGTAD